MSATVSEGRDGADGFYTVQSRAKSSFRRRVLCTAERRRHSRLSL